MIIIFLSGSLMHSFRMSARIFVLALLTMGACVYAADKQANYLLPTICITTRSSADWLHSACRTGFDLCATISYTAAHAKPCPFLCHPRHQAVDQRACERAKINGRSSCPSAGSRFLSPAIFLLSHSALHPSPGLIQAQ